jgi:LmbE family N-acetylglucosaminyl deacetylase
MEQQVVVERTVTGRPHAGKVLAIIAPHSDDISLLAGGTVAKLVDEGYTAYAIRVTNDEKDSYGMTTGETILGNERDTREVARILGIKGVYDLNYRNHRVDDVPRTEMRARLIFLFRMLRVDTVMGFDAWAVNEVNPDHYVTAQVADAACWMAGMSLDLPEQFAVGLKPHAVSEKYLWWTWWAGTPGLATRVVDVSPYIEQKIEAMCANRTELRNTVRTLQDKLAERRLRLRLLEADDDTAIRNYVNVMCVEPAAKLGRAHGLEYAEQFHYTNTNPWITDWVLKNAEPMP